VPWLVVLYKQWRPAAYAATGALVLLQIAVTVAILEDDGIDQSKDFSRRA
jgi:hypothetical protein